MSDKLIPISKFTCNYQSCDFSTFRTVLAGTGYTKFDEARSKKEYLIRTFPILAKYVQNGKLNIQADFTGYSDESSTHIMDQIKKALTGQYMSEANIKGVNFLLEKLDKEGRLS